MSMNYYPARGYLVEFTRDNVEKLGLPKDVVDKVFDIIESSPADSCNFCYEESDEKTEFLKQFINKYNLVPYFIYLNEEIDGFDGVATPSTLYLTFGEDEKYKREVRKEWDTLPIEPEESSWCEFG